MMSGIAFNVLWVVCVLLLLLALFLAIRRRRLAQQQAVRARQQVYGYDHAVHPDRTTQFYGPPSHVVSPGPSRAHDLEMGNVQAPPPVYKPEDAPPPAYQDYRKDIRVQPSTSS